MSIVLDNSKLRQLDASDLAGYFRGLLKKFPEEAISNPLFVAIERESVAPDVATTWLSIAKSPATLLLALKQDFSALTRVEAIKLFVKLLNGDQWQEYWDGIGGTQSLVSLLGQFSVANVKLFFKALLRSINGLPREEQRRNFSHLLQGLLPRIYPDAPFKSKDGRPLLDYYRLLLPICDSEFLDGILRDKHHPLFSVGWGLPRARSHFLRQQYKILRQQCLDKIFEKENSFIDISVYFGPLLQNSPGHPSAEPGDSESMTFSLNALREFAAHPDITVPGFSVLKELVEPLIRRAWRKHHSWEKVREIMDLSMNYLSHQTSEANRVSVHRLGLVSSCIKFWAYKRAHREECEHRLISILRIIPSEKKWDLREFEAITRRLPKPLRYHLLKILFLNTGEHPINIDEVEGLRKSSITNWPHSMFPRLPQSDAIHLLERLISAFGDHFLSPDHGNTIIRLPPSQNHWGANPVILLNFLEQGQEGALERASAGIEEQKKKSTKSREQTDRAYHANLALFQAISTGSLELYRDTMIWARRFLRDPLTVKSIFSPAVSNTLEGIHLLSGFPHHLSQLPKLTASDISRRVQDGNLIIFEALETVCLALKEPSFYKPDWNGLIQLLSDVVSKRFDLSEMLQSTLNLSDDEVYELLWSDTLDKAIRLEKLVLSDGHEPLLLRHPAGLLSSRFSPSTSSFRFIDKLACERDSLWRGFRAGIYPAVVVLPATLPRGLPIQCLNYPFNVGLESACGLTPFIYLQAKRVVFADSSEALRAVPEDDETRLAIGTFVDSFSEALRIFVLQGTSSEDRQSRALEAWEHALGRLSERMTPDEAHRTWEVKFRQALPREISIPAFKSQVPVPELDLDHLLFPSDAEIGEYSEWSPADAFKPPPAIKSRQLHPFTYLDLSVSSYSRPDLGDKFVESIYETEGFRPPAPESLSFWSVWKAACKKSNIPTGREGLSMFALLFLEHYIPNHKSILRNPFPFEGDVRFPDVWLDISFAEIDRIKAASDSSAFSTLQECVSTLPASLLYKLTESSFNALSKLPSDEIPAKVARAERLAYGFLSLLAKCDRPSLAIGFILNVVIDRPNSSAWHREFLTIPFLRSLSPSEAKYLIQLFGEGIARKVKEQDESSKQTTKPSTDKDVLAPRPFIKITTIKYLAQLIGGADFIPEDFGAQILGTLFETSAHIDVRVAVVESLMGMLKDCDETESSNLLGHQILQVLKSTIPIAGRLDERYQLREREWEMVNRTRKLPDVFEQGKENIDHCIGPVLSVIMNGRFVKLKWQKKLMVEIIFPILEESIANNRQWLVFFTLKHGLELDSLEIPILPVKPKFLRMIVSSHREDIPSSVMELYQKFILTNMSPPPSVAALNKKIREDSRLYVLQENKHWLSLYGHGPSAYNYDSFNLMSFLLTNAVAMKEPEPNQNNPISEIQNYSFRQAELLLSMNLPVQFEHFMDRFGYSGRVVTMAEPLRHAKILVERIIALITSLRTPKWQRDLNRKPAFLPQTLRYRLWFLPFPIADSDAKRSEDFVEKLRGYVREICREGNAYHEELPLIKNAAMRVEPGRRAEVACLLGELKNKEEVGIVELLCLEIARDLFKTASWPKDEVVFNRGKKVVQSWRISPIESVRAKWFKLSLKG